MKSYDISQLIIFFYIYSFLGWVYESTIVSVREKRLVNRGFLNGTMLPIYGFGATTILYATKPFAENPLMVFFVGMICATLLEYVAGYLLEKLFKIRYWDYTGYFGNIKGYICTLSVIVWGLFSLLMVYVLHKPIERFLEDIPNIIELIGTILISVFFIWDVIISVKKAYDFKALAEKAAIMHTNLVELEEKLAIEEKLEYKKEEIIAFIEKNRFEAAENIAKITKIKEVIEKHNPKADISAKYNKVLNDIKNRIDNNKS